MFGVESLIKLANNDHSIFYNRPPVSWNIDEELKTRYASSQKIQTLMEELKENGPHVALGKFGPHCYEEAPFKLKNTFCKREIYGWKAGQERKEYSKSRTVFVLGARIIEEKEVVYFTLCDDITQDTHGFVRRHVSSKTDTKIYVVSHDTFRNYITDLYAPVSNEDRDSVNRLISISPMDSILDRGENEALCKSIGQEIFDSYKAKANGDSESGREAVKKILHVVRSASTDGRLRAGHIERAWDGVGDDYWRWMH